MTACKEGFQTQNFVEFLNTAPSRYHAIEKLGRMFSAAGFSERYDLTDVDNDFYITFNRSSLIAVRLPESKPEGFIISASHSDSPTFRIKSEPELLGSGYTRINTEGYGGMLCSTWLDRPLSVAGRVFIKCLEGVKTELLNIDRDCLIIPNLAIHMSPKANKGAEFKVNVDMVPMFKASEEEGAFKKLIACELNVDESDIMGFDLHLYNRQNAVVWGEDGEFISGGRLDDLQCAYTTASALLSSERSKTHAQIFYVSDNEEIGSDTKQGAGAMLLPEVLRVISEKYGCNEAEYNKLIRNSFMLSCDNAHARHPNHPEVSDPKMAPKINGGVVVKYGMRYTTDGASEAILNYIAQKEGLTLQRYSNRSDMAGGATLGNIANTKVPVNTVDIGIAQLAMHSAYETAGVRDMEDLYRLAKACYEAGVMQTRDGDLSIN